MRDVELIDNLKQLACFHKVTPSSTPPPPLVKDGVLDISEILRNGENVPKLLLGRCLLILWRGFISFSS